MARGKRVWIGGVLSLLLGGASCRYDFGRAWQDGASVTTRDATVDVRQPPARADARADLPGPGWPPDFGPDLPPPDLAPPPDLTVDAPPGRWYQAVEAHCPTFCAGLGQASVDGPEQASCASGEVRPASALAQGIQLVYGCPNSCDGQAGPLAATSVHEFCYRAGQKQDDDLTDLTVGCFCR